MPLNAFIIRPFGSKEVVLPSTDDHTHGDKKLRTSEVISINFDVISEKLLDPALRRLKMVPHTTEVVISAGNIREDMFHLLMTADLVIADVTLHNPNVFYELGIRHAFRDRFTFLIRSSVSVYPFDLQTDRYFVYDHLEPEKSVEKLYEAIRATLNSERADSPVFRLLPRMRTEDRSKFISVPRDFIEEVERARKHKRGGDLRLLAAECEGFLWEVEGLREVGRAQFELNFMGGARATWEGIAQRYPDDMEANMILSTVYQRGNDTTRSEQALARLSRCTIGDVNREAEVRSLVGRNLKAEWMNGWLKAKGLDNQGRQELALRSPLLRKAIEAYNESFRINLNYPYAGLSALTLQIVELSLAQKFPFIWKLLHDNDREAQQVLEQRLTELRRLASALEYAIECKKGEVAGAGEVDFWFEILEAAFACLTSDSPEKVAQAYLEAVQWAPRYAEGSMKRALELYDLLDVKHPDAASRVDIQANARGAIKTIREEDGRKSTGNIVLFVGLRVAPSANSGTENAGNGLAATQNADKDSKGAMRFLAPGMVAKAREAIKAVLEKERKERGDFLFGMAAMANGSEILFHEVCAELRIDTRVYLALPKDQYVGEYVAPAGADWVDRFNNIYKEHRATESANRMEGPAADPDRIINVMTDSMEMPRWLQSKTAYTVGRRNAIWMLQHALVQRYLQNEEETDLTLVVLWDGHGDAESNGGIQRLVVMAERNGIKVIQINCKDWADEGSPQVEQLSNAVGSNGNNRSRSSADQQSVAQSA